MAEAYLDTNVLIRLLTADDAEQTGAAADLMASAAKGSVRLILPETILAEAVWVLQRRYGRARRWIADELRAFVASEGLVVEDLALLDAALEMYGERALDFPDCLLAARALVHGPPLVYSFDRDFEQVPGLRRLEPGEAVA